MAIERKFVTQNLKEFMIKEFVMNNLSRVGLSDIKLQRTPLGDKIIVRASRPGLVVGRGGSNIQRLTTELKNKFNLENPQIEIEEVASFGLDANVIAEMIVNSLERFGSNRFKGVGHKALSDVMNAGALGVEILISGKIPGSRAKTWRFYQGYLKKCGDVAVTSVKIAYKTAVLKTGAVGVKVSILPPDALLPDKVEVHEATIEEVSDPDVKAEMEAVVENVAVSESSGDAAVKNGETVDVITEKKTSKRKSNSKKTVRSSKSEDNIEEGVKNDKIAKEETVKEGVGGESSKRNDAGVKASNDGSEDTAEPGVKNDVK